MFRHSGRAQLENRCFLCGIVVRVRVRSFFQEGLSHVLGVGKMTTKILPLASPCGLATVGLLLWQRPSGLGGEDVAVEAVCVRLSPGRAWTYFGGTSAFEGERACFAILVVKVDAVLGH